jgi:flagellar biosynthesis protein FlhG
MKVACEKFLGVTCYFLGAVHNDPNLPLAVRDQKPFVKNYPDSPASRDIRVIADRILSLRGTKAEAIAKKPVLSWGNNNIY